MLRAISVAVLLACVLASSARAQDTSLVYPWRISNFPYVTVSPNDGVMLMYRGVLFRQSRWDDRASIHDQVALEAGYSTHGSWLARATANLPHLFGGGRFYFIGETEHLARFTVDSGAAVSANRFSGATEVSVPFATGTYVAFRTSATQLNLTGTHELTLGVRGALVLDRRDREYDTRNGFLAQAGAFVGHVSGKRAYAEGSETFHGWYAMLAGWGSLSERTRITARGMYRRLGQYDQASLEAKRSVPAWEDPLTVLGGAQSNRALSVGQYPARNVALMSGEIRHDLKVFPAGAIAVLAFVDAGDANDNNDDVFNTGPPPSPTLRMKTQQPVSPGWVVGVGGGVAIRLLRNAILTATVGVAQSKARLYVSSGWSW